MFIITEQPRRAGCTSYEKEARKGNKLVSAVYSPEAGNIIKVSLHVLEADDAQTFTKITEEVFGLSEVSGYNEAFARLLNA